MTYLLRSSLCDYTTGDGLRVKHTDNKHSSEHQTKTAQLTSPSTGSGAAVTYKAEKNVCSLQTYSVIRQKTYSRKHTGLMLKPVGDCLQIL